MYDVPAYQEAIAHYFAGVAISLGDRLFSKNAKRHTKERLEEKVKQVEAMNYLIEAQDDIKSSPEYAANIRTVRQYFVDKGEKLDGEKKGLITKIRESFKYERINSLSVTGKLGTAFGIELAADAIVAVRQVVGGVGNAIEAIGESLYQGPAMFFGFLTGKGILYVKDCFRSSDEKEIDGIAYELTKDGKLLELVKNYSPTAGMKVDKKAAEEPEDDDLEEKTEKPKESKAPKEESDGIGEKIGDAVLGTVDAVKGVAGSAVARITERIAERKKKEREAEEQRAKNLKKPYEDY